MLLWGASKGLLNIREKYFDQFFCLVNVGDLQEILNACNLGVSDHFATRITLPIDIGHPGVLLGSGL